MPTKVLLSAPKFGAWLQLQRGECSLEQIAVKVRPLVQATGLKVDASLIHKIERGRVPSWPMLGALCRVYERDIREVVLQLIEVLEFPGAADLLCQSVGVQVASTLPTVQEGGATHGIPAPAREIADELRSITDAFVGAVQDVADRLARGVADAPIAHAPRKPRSEASDRVRRARKVG